MEESLSERQRQILKAVIEEYIKTAEPVSSQAIEKKYNPGVSPATIRNEMGKLIEEGFLKQPHTSAGRVPTPKALKFYVETLMTPKELSVADEVSIKQKVWDYRLEFDKLLREATRELAQKTRALAVATTNEGDVYYSGTCNLLDMPEFFDIDLTRSMLSFLDRFDYVESIFEKVIDENQIHMLLGEEIGYNLSPCGVIFTHYSAGPKHQGEIGVIGPMRLNFPTIIPQVKYFGNLISEISRAW
jgi:heat-inducible transcriptional repressor